MDAPFSHVTVPVDGSAASERGIQFALELVKGGGAVTFYNVVDPATACVPAAAGAAIDPAPVIATLEENARRACLEAEEEAGKRGIPATSVVLFGERGNALSESTKDGTTDAIVIGTHGRTGLVRAIFGSVTEELLCHADVPVIAVHADDAVRVGPIAVAMDESAPARGALEIAIRLARAWSARLEVIHVIEDARRRPADAGFVDDVAETLRNEGIPFDLTSLVGHASEEIVSTANALGCSAIVMGTHGRTAVPRFFLGSVANAVVESARLPVIVVRYDPM
jgi:nucleotide-binding universal stress UspA family protein